MAGDGPIVGILLAAGSGSCFGSDKLLHPLANGRPLALAAAERLHATCERAIAAVRPGSDEFAARLAGEGYEVVVSAQAPYGMGHSLAAGVRASPQASGWLVALADMPGIALSTYQCIADALRGGASIAAPVLDGRRGHPVGFARQWFEALANLSGDAGAPLHPGRISRRRPPWRGRRRWHLPRRGCAVRSDASGFPTVASPSAACRPPFGDEYDQRMRCPRADANGFPRCCAHCAVMPPSMTGGRRHLSHRSLR